MTDKKKSIVERFAERASSEAATRSHPGIVGGPPSSAAAPRAEPANGTASHRDNGTASHRDNGTASHRDFGSGAQSLNMANINLQALGQSGYVVPGAARSKIVEEMRAIKRPLLLNAFEPSHPATGRDHVIMVTSTQPDEGKTFVAANLAMSIASEKGSMYYS
jgi:protein-tyrosine kinase